MKFTRYPKRDAIWDYFPLPNEIFSLGLSTGEIAMYAYLMCCEDRKTFQCHPSYKTIGNAVGKRKKFNIYADTREECEEKLAEMIKQKNAESTAEKEKLKSRQNT